MAYADIYAAATASDHVLRKQVAVAIVKAAVDVMNESTATEDHSQRMTWARRALSDPLGWAEKAIWKVLEHRHHRHGQWCRNRHRGVCLRWRDCDGDSGRRRES
jgi:hypothetical protein